MHTKRAFAFSKQYNSITTAELIAGTSGCLLAAHHSFSSSAFCLLVAFHAAAISAHPRATGNSLRSSRDHFELLIFALRKGASGVWLPVIDTAEHLHCHRASVNTRSQAVASHADAQAHIRLMHGWPSIPQYRLWQMQREAHIQTHTVVLGFSQRWCCVGSRLCKRLHFLWHDWGRFKLREYETTSAAFLCACM